MYCKIEKKDGARLLVWLSLNCSSKSAAHQYTLARTASSLCFAICGFAIFVLYHWNNFTHILFFIISNSFWYMPNKRPDTTNWPARFTFSGGLLVISSVILIWFPKVFEGSHTYWMQQCRPIALFKPIAISHTCEKAFQNSLHLQPLKTGTQQEKWEPK